MNALLGEVNKAVKENRVQDQTEERGAFVREVIPENKTGYPARFIGYVEIGDRPQPDFQGKAKPDCRTAYLFFQLLSKKLEKEITVDGETKVVYPVHRERVDVKVGEKANLTKLFKRMAAGRDITHIAQMLGEPFRVGISHNPSTKDPKVVYENARTKDDGWLIFPPTIDVMGDDGEITTKVMKVPEAREELRLLLWDDPSEAQWASIKGRPFEYGEKDKKKTYAGGYLQYICVHEATDFEGSPLQAMLAGTQLPDLESIEDETEEPAVKPAGKLTTIDADEDLGLDEDFLNE